jgi:cob(I)alamin adenosyltransferase
MTVIANIGEGKGKTTAAMGQVVRALGNGSKNVIIVQFNKNDQTIGEYKFFFERMLDVDCRILQFGVRCTHPVLRRSGRCVDCGACSKNSRLNRTKVEWALQHIGKKQKDFDVIVLDEILVSLSHGYITTEEIEDMINIDETKTWIMTGRIFGKKVEVPFLNPKAETVTILPKDPDYEHVKMDWVMKFSDYVTEMRQLKHPYNRGVKAKVGLEY